MSARKRDRDEDSETSSKRSKIEYDVFYQALSDSVRGNPTKPRLQRLRLSDLLSICHDFSLWDNGSGGKKLTKGDCVERIMSHLQDLQDMESPNQSNDEPMELCTKKSSMISIRLYNNPTDYETRYVAEVEAPRSPCGGLNLFDLPNLFQTSGTFEIVEARRYKPILINSQNRIVPREMLEILLRDSKYVRVICMAQPT